MKQSIPGSTSLFSPSTATVAAFLFCSLMAGSGQTVASTPPYVVTDVGPFYRVWQRTVPLTNSTTGQITQQVQRYTELEDGIYYPSNGMWVESQDLIEISSNGAQAVHGPMQAAFDADITSRGAVTLTSPSGEVFKSHPLGLFYSDPGSGKVAQIASIQPSVGRLYPPNVVVFSNALSGLRADLMLVWAKNGYEQNLVIEQAPPLPESFGLSSATAHLQFWSAIDDWPEPLEQRQVQLKPGLTDHILMFNGCWFPVGSAFALGAQPTPTAGQPVRIRVLSPSDPGAVPVAKSIVTIGNQKVLIEELNYTDLASAFTALPRAASPANKGKLLRLAGDVGVPPKSLAPRTNTSRIDVASTGYSPSGVVIDYTTLFGNTNSYTFYGGETYRINNAFTVGPGLATFQQNACIKFAFGSYLLLSGTVAFPPSYPVVFTSKDDNWYGYTMPDSTAEPGYSAAKAIWIYYPTVQTTINNALVRCAGRCVRYDQSRPALAPLISNSAFQRSFIGAEVNIPGDIITLSRDTSCNDPTPVSIVAGSVAGTVTADCGVSPPAMVNDPRTDLTGLDPSKNSQSECSFVLPDSSTVVAAFWNTHLSEYALGIDHSDFPGIVSPRSISWAVSGNSGSTFSDSGPILPISTTIRNGTLVANGAAAVTNGDAGDPVMCYDPGTGGPNGTIYLLANPSREQSYWNGFRLWKSTDKGATFTFVNGNVPGAVVAADKPMIKVSSTTHDIYAAGAQAGNTVWAAHSGNGGLSWDNYKTIETSSPSSGTDIAIDASGTVYFFWLQGAGTGPTVNKLRYAWLLSTNWSSP